MTATAEELYAQRERRFNDAVALKGTDRVPVMPLYVHNFPTLIKGVSNRAAIPCSCRASLAVATSNPR